MLKILKKGIEKIQGQLLRHLGLRLMTFYKVDWEMEILVSYLVAQEVVNLGL